MNFHIVTLFPESLDSYINSSILGRAISNKKIKVKFYNPRDYTKDKHRRVDQKPYGGGPGMVIEAPSIIKAVEKAIKGKGKKLVIWLSPSGKKYTNDFAKKISKKYSDVIIICGRYEGVDERVRKIFRANKISIGEYILTGGELPAMVIMDTIARHIPGVLGKIESLEENRISSSEVYTRPEVITYKNKKYKVPKILLSGNHALIGDWRKNK